MRSSCLRKSYSTGDKNESSLPVEGDAYATEADILCDRETSSEEPIGSLVVVRKPVALIFLRRKTWSCTTTKLFLTEKGAICL
ncbi:hypothetical protein U1Q18_002142 [Sarracenia purpurea var. burkii]